MQMLPQFNSLLTNGLQTDIFHTVFTILRRLKSSHGVNLCNCIPTKQIVTTWLTVPSPPYWCSTISQQEQPLLLLLWLILLIVLLYYLQIFDVYCRRMHQLDTASVPLRMSIVNAWPINDFRHFEKIWSRFSSGFLKNIFI